jgi:hypothetical protein
MLASLPVDAQRVEFSQGCYTRRHMAEDEKPPTKRKPGRPREIHESTVSVSTWLPVSTADRLYRLAAEQRTSVSSLLRSWLTRRTS